MDEQVTPDAVVETPVVEALEVVVEAPVEEVAAPVAPESVEPTV